MFSRQYTFIMFLMISLLGCNDATISKGSEKARNDSTAQPEEHNDTSRQTINSFDKKELSVEILGNWSLVGTDASTFVIDKEKIFYPETSASYKYSIVKDTLKIKYDDYEGVFIIKKKHTDTLVLTNDETQVYYRFDQ